MGAIYKKDDRLTVTITDLGGEGEGIGKVDGYTLFIKPGLEEETYLYKESVVEYGDLVMGIVESGSVTAEEESQNFTLNLETEEEDDDSEDSDDEEDTTKYLEIEESYIVIGQRVEKGEPIYKLAEDSVASVRSKLELEAAEAQTALAEAQLCYPFA